MMKNIKRKVEERLGYTISDAECQSAYEYASMKLEFQSRLFNREYDQRYLIEVTAEEVRQQRFVEEYEQLEKDIRAYNERILQWA